MFAAFSPALWGIGGAFIYAGPRWAIALRGAPDALARPVLVTLDLLICLMIGGIGAAAFSPFVETLILTALHVRDNNTTCAAIGWLLNPLAPLLVEKGSGALDDGLSLVARVLKAIRGTEK